ncbi:MAG: PorV/PorQ family protein [Bacteroidota bacterium]
MRPIAARCATVASWLLLVLAPSTVRAAAGETGFASLKLGVGARAMGMGSAYVALADDPTATYWNPAGLAQVRGTELTAMHNEWIQDFRQEYAAVGAPIGSGTLGFAFSGFYTSQLEGRDEVGNFTRNFGFNDVTMTAAYGRPLANGLDGGIAVRYLREMIDQTDASTVAADVGARYRLGASGLSLGAAAQNIGGKPKFVSESFDLPLTLRVGAALTRPIGSIHSVGTLTTELRKARDENARFHVGGELLYKEHLALRAGAKFGYDAEDVSFGIGIPWNKIRFDYALVPMSQDLGTAHFFSLTAKL